MLLIKSLTMLSAMKLTNLFCSDSHFSDSVRNTLMKRVLLHKILDVHVGLSLVVKFVAFIQLQFHYFESIFR